MPDWSRRHALQAAGSALVAGIAGCNEGPGTGRPPRRRGRVENAMVLKVRNVAGEPMVTGERPDDDEQQSTEEPPRRRGSLMLHVTEMGSDADLTPVFPSGVPGASELEAFFRETDFEAESIYLAQSAIPECYERNLTGVYREGDGVDAQFCRTVRPADVACGADNFDMIAFAIRLPFAGDEFNSVGGGHSSRCDAPHHRIVDPDTNLTVGSDGGSDQ